MFWCFLCLFLFFCVAFVSVVCVLFLVLWLDVVFFLLFFFGGFKGQVRWPEGPPHLALNPPYFICFCFFGFSFVFFWGGGGFKGQVRWPEGPPHLALNPPYFTCFCCCCFFFSFFFFGFVVFASVRKNLFSPLKMGHFLCIFSVSPFVSL